MKWLKKTAAPAIITLLFIIYLIWSGIGITGGTATGGIWSVVVFLVILGLAGASLYVLIQRIDELKKEDEDDVSRKY